MESPPDAGYALFGAEALHKRLQTLTRECGLRRAEDAESIHRMRVASRRMRAALDLFKDTLPRKKYPGWEKQVKRVTRALSAARDTDVQIAAVEESFGRLNGPGHRPGIARLKLRLQQRRARLQTDVSKVLEAWETSAVADNMGRSLCWTLVRARMNRVQAVSPAVVQRAHAPILRRLEEFLSYEFFVDKPERAEELHAMRIAAKRLRYTLEIFAPLDKDKFKTPLKAVREAQELLGGIHDGDVWAQFLPQFIEKERARMVEYMGNARAFSRLAVGLRRLQEDRQECRDRQYRAFVRFWKRTQEQAVWERLRRRAQAYPAPVEPPPPAAPPDPENPA